jgi:pyrroline-5-carboxylate reductase
VKSSGASLPQLQLPTLTAPFSYFLVSPRVVISSNKEFSHSFTSQGSILVLTVHHRQRVSAAASFLDFLTRRELSHNYGNDKRHHAQGGKDSLYHWMRCECARSGDLDKADILLGTMGAAILSGVLESCSRAQANGEEPKISRFIATVNSEGSADALQRRFEGYADRFDVRRGENVTAMREADIVLLAFKPYMVDLVLRQPGVREALAGKLIISVLVGSPPAKLEEAIFNRDSDFDWGEIPRKEQGKPLYIKRAMLNIAAEFRESMTVIETTNMPRQYEEITEWIFLQLGKIQPVAPDLFDIGGVLAGASGALLSVAFDGMLDGAVKQGLKRADAKKILTHSLFSMAKLLENEHPAVLRERFSSPKGTTIDGLLSLEEDRARYAFSKAVIASTKRSLEIGK